MKTKPAPNQPSLFDTVPAGDGQVRFARDQRSVSEEQTGLTKIKRIGQMPKGWEMKRLADVSEINPKKDKHIKDSLLVSFIEMSDVDEEARLCNATNVPYEKVAKGYTSFKRGDILVAKITPCFENGKGALISKLTNNYGFGSTEFHVIRPIDIDGQFLHFHTQTHWFRAGGRTHMTGSAGQKRVPTYFIQEYLIPSPTLEEQRKIARILSTWDRALSELEALVAAKTERLNGLTQRLFGGSHQSARATDNSWEVVRVGDVTRELRQRNRGGYGEDRLYGVDKFAGMIPNGDRVQPANISNYKVVPPKAFAYNPMRLNIGSIARLEEPFPVLVSPDYIVFEASPDKLSSDYLNHFRRGHQWKTFVERTGSGSVRVRIYYRHISHMKLRLPPLSEQIRIAKILDLAVNELDLLRQERDTLARQKKGLMQRLLTGQVRVTPDPEDVL